MFVAFDSCPRWARSTFDPKPTDIPLLFLDARALWVLMAEFPGGTLTVRGFDAFVLPFWLLRPWPRL